MAGGAGRHIGSPRLSSPRLAGRFSFWGRQPERMRIGWFYQLDPPGAQMTSTPTGLGARIVCFTDTTICDGPSKYRHEIQLWTDGIVAFAEALGFTESLTVARDLTQIEVTCIEGCTGHARFDLQDEAWTTDLRAVAMLDSHGERIES